MFCPRDPTSTTFRCFFFLGVIVTRKELTISYAFAGIRVVNDLTLAQAGIRIHIFVLIGIFISSSKLLTSLVQRVECEERGKKQNYILLRGPKSPEWRIRSNINPINHYFLDILHLPQSQHICRSPGGGERPQIQQKITTYSQITGFRYSTGS